MEKLLQFIYNQLKSTGYKVFDSQVPSATTYPYITYRISEPSDNNNPQIFDLTINVWDNQNSTYRVETLTSQIESMINPIRYTDTEVSIFADKQARNPIDDPTLKRRQLVYELRVFFM